MVPRVSIGQSGVSANSKLNLAYNPVYHPRTWRGFYGFGSGLLGDWSCHTLDAPFWALGLGRDEALEVITGQIGVIAAQTEQICLDAGMPETTRQLLWRRSILNPDVCSNGFTHLDPG